MRTRVADLCYVDTNVLLRLLLADHPSHSPAAVALLREARARELDLAITPSTISECVYVLGGARLGFTRMEVAAAIEAVLALPATLEDRDLVNLALDLFRTVHNDWDDCLVAAYALRRAHGRLVSFDKGLERIPGVVRLEP